MTAQRRDELLGAFGLAKELGWSAMAVALTVRHGIGHDATKLTQLLSKAYRLTFERAGLRKVLKGYGFQGAIRIVEVNYSAENGYHPHLHLVLMFDRQIGNIERADVEAELFHQWVLGVNDARIRVGLDCGLPDALHGVHVELLDLAKGPEYFVKVGLVTELLGEFAKSGRGRETWTMWEVARDMVVNDRHGLTERAEEAEGIWHGYVRAMKHFKSFFVATRLRRKLLAPLQLELGLTDTSPEPVVVYGFDETEYGLLRRAGPVAMAAVDRMVEEGRDGEAIRSYLLQLAEHFADVDDQARCRDPVPFTVHAPLTRLGREALDSLVYGSGASADRTQSMVATYDPIATFDRLLAAA